VRSTLRFSITDATGDPKILIRRMDCAWFRNFFFVLTKTGATYRADVYADKDTAVARAVDNTTTGRLATAAAIPANESTAVFTVSSGAAFDPTPMTIDWTITGSFTNAVVGFVDSPEAYVLDRVQACLVPYMAANESLALCNVTSAEQIIQSHVRPGIVAAGRPVIGLAMNTMDFEPFMGSTLVDLGPTTGIYAWVTGSPMSSSANLCARLMGTLRSILCDEQRKLAGMALTTRPLAPGNGWRIAEEYASAESQGFFWRGFMPLVHHITNAVSALENSSSTGSGYGGGGHYAPLEP